MPTTQAGRDARRGRRNIEILRLRMVEGRTLKATGEAVGIGTERVRQILRRYFGIKRMDFIPPGNVREMRADMREQLAVARQQIHDAQSPSQIAEGRTHLDLLCDMLDVLGWDDLETETAVPVESIRVSLRRNLARVHALAETHDQTVRQRALDVAALIEAMLTLI